MEKKEAEERAAFDWNHYWDEKMDAEFSRRRDQLKRMWKVAYDLSRAAGHNFYDIMKEEMVVVEEESIVARAVRNYVLNHGDDLSRVHAWKKVYNVSHIRISYLTWA